MAEYLEQPESAEGIEEMKNKHGIHGITKESFNANKNKLNLISWPWSIEWEKCDKSE